MSADKAGEDSAPEHVGGAARRLGLTTAARVALGGAPASPTRGGGEGPANNDPASDDPRRGGDPLGGAAPDDAAPNTPGAAAGAPDPDRDRARAPLVFLAYPRTHVALASAIAEALNGSGYRLRPGPPIEEWPIEAWTGAARLEGGDAEARAEAQAVVVIWSEDPSLDAALRFEADVALARIALAAVLAPKRAASRLPERFRSKLLSGGETVAAVASAVAAHLAAAAERAPSADARTTEDPLASMEERVRRLSELGLREEAVEARRAVVDYRRRLLDAAPTGRRARTLGRRLGAATIDLAERLSELGRNPEAARAAYSAADLMRRMRDEHGLAADIALARALTIAAQCRARTHRWSAAADALDEAVAIYRRLHLAHPALSRPRLALLLGRLAEARLGESRRQDAETAAMESLAHFRALARGGEASDLENLAEALERLCEIQLALSRPAAAAAAVAEAVELYREAGASEEDLAPALLRHGRALLAMNRTDEALSHLTEATSLARSLAEIDPDEFRPLLGETLGEIAGALLRLGRTSEAADFAAQGLSALGPELGGERRALFRRGGDERLLDDPERPESSRLLRRRLMTVRAAPRRRRRRRIALGLAAGATVLAALAAVAFGYGAAPGFGGF